MLHRIYILSTFGDLTKKSVVGGHSRKFLYLLTKLGYEVVPINRNSPRNKSLKFAKLYTLFWGIIAMLNFLKKILFANRKQCITINISYCGTMMPFDAMTVCMAKWLGFKHVLYLKGGRAKRIYNHGSKIYKWLFKMAVSNSKLIYTEGEENISLCQSICDTTIIYLPNYTEDGFAPENLSQKHTDEWKFLYFGRMCDDKNVELVINIFDEICKSNKNSSLQLIGKGDEEYLDKLDTRINLSPNKAKIIRRPAINHDELKSVLQVSHFFIFPSKEPNEGHSNSLNEAMAYGLVPIVSNNNFLPLIVACDDLVSTSYSAVEYAEIVQHIISSNSFTYYSNKMHERVKENFTQERVEGRIFESLNNLFK